MERECDERPWGRYEVLEDALTHKVKRIEVRPGRRLSYQRHQRRAEHWFVVEGTAQVTLDGTDHLLTATMAIDIPARAAHRVANAGDELLVFIEVQVGDYFGEDDIERLEDDFGRARLSVGPAGTGRIGRIDPVTGTGRVLRRHVGRI